MVGSRANGRALVQTAEAIAAHQSNGVELQIDERIRERVSNIPLLRVMH